MKQGILVVSFIAALFSAQAQITFFEGTDAEVIAKAKAEKKMILVDCYTEWCHWCKVLDKETFPDKAVGEFYNSNFICVKRDMEREGVELGAQFRVRGFPTTLIFNTEGYLLANVSGYRPPAEYIQMGQKAMANNPATALSKFGDPVKLPAFYMKALTDKRGLKEGEKPNRTKPTKKQLDAYFNGKTSLKSESDWSVFSRFIYDGPMVDVMFSEYEALQAIYGGEIRDKVSDICRSLSTVAAKEQDKVKLNKSIDMVKTYFDEADRAGTILYYEIAYYKEGKDWPMFGRKVDAYVKMNGMEKSVGMLNRFCWEIYEKNDEKFVLDKAEFWMKSVVDVSPTYAFLDTYAAVLYKNGNYEEAKLQAEAAIKSAKEEGTDSAETEALLTKIEAKTTK